MKYNLRNMPKLHHLTDMKVWKEGFEAELRKRIRSLEKEDRTAYGKQILLEILGEET